MAKIIPDGWQDIQATGALQREMETLAILALALPDQYVIYHGVHWTRVERGFAIFGEVDFAIVNPAGRLLLIEQKAGFLDETPEGLVKKYARKEKNVPLQIHRSLDGLQARFAKAHPGDRLQVDFLLYCPDYTVKNPAIAGIDPARIVDASRRGYLAQLIRSALPPDEPAVPVAEKVHRFLGDELQLVPDVRAMVGQAETLVTRISGGLAAWGRRLEFDPFRLRVVGTAGSGKTQLALAVYRDAVAAGRRPLYVCYNRPLADHFARIAPPGGEVATYHQLCDRAMRSIGQAPDFSEWDAFRKLEAGFAALERGRDGLYDELIVDEGQDFQVEWLEPLLRRLKPEGRAWWLEDPMQNLYGRAPIPLPGWVTLHADTNYRSPRDILEHIARIVPMSRPVEPGSPLTGSDVDIVSYANPADLIDRTKRQITECIKLGFKRDMIAVVTFRGREQSAFMPFDKLGPYTLRTFTGKYDLFGSPVYSEGDVLLETVYRFKGQSAPCVILTEVDFETLDDRAERKLFVGATRATMKLVMIVSERAAQALLARIAT